MSLTNQKIEQVFHQTFTQNHKARLFGGYDEPEYIPAKDDKPAKICYRADYAESALHEVAHWCVAGEARRKLADYGYWYAPDGRNALQQKAFFEVEFRPQALEWLFCSAAGLKFRPSVDNLSLVAGRLPELPEKFIDNMKQAAIDCLQGAKDSRAMQFSNALMQESGCPLILVSEITETVF